MAKLSRLQLFHRTTKKFLHNLKKNHKEEWGLVNQTIRDRYLSDDKSNEDSSYNFFGQTKAGERDKNLSAMAQDIYQLLTLFENNQQVNGMDSFRLLSRLFSEQCEIEPSGVPEETLDAPKVKVKEPKSIPSNSLQNPSDPDASYSGHKGQGYHVQLMETCSESKQDGDVKFVNLITHVSVHGADVHDSKALQPAIEDTEKIGMKPEVILADTAYGSDGNVEAAKTVGVEVVSPVGGSDPEANKIRLAEFSFNENGIVENCPEGQKPWVVNRTKTDNVVCGFNKGICDVCPNQGRCPVVISGERAELKYSPKDLRLSKRRAFERDR